MSVQIGEASGVLGLVLDFGFERFGHACQVQQPGIRRVERRLQQRCKSFGQLATGQTHLIGVAAPFATDCGGLAGTRCGSAPTCGVRRVGSNLRVHMVHAEPRHLLKRQPQCGGQFGGVDGIRQVKGRAHVQGTLRQLVYPTQAGQVHVAGELVQRHTGQVMRFVQHQQAMVQLGQHTGTQRRQQQVVVGHDHLCAHQIFTSLKVGAAVEQRAVFARTRCRFGRNGHPQVGFGIGGQ